MLISLEDERAALHFPRGIQRLLTALGGRSEILPQWLGFALLHLSQQTEERKHRRMRRALIELEESVDDLLMFSGPRI